MNIRTIGARFEPGHAELLAVLNGHDSLGTALTDWTSKCSDARVAGELPRVIVQDEYSHDVILRWGKQRYVVYATT